MVIETSTVTESSRGIQVEGTKQGEVAVSSDSMALLKAGLAATNKHAENLKKNWDIKKADSKIVFRCKTCGKQCKSKAGVMGHWRAKSNECTAEKGYEEVPEIAVSVEDRLSPEQVKGEKLRQKGMEAAKKVAKEMQKTKKVQDNLPKADELYAAHLSKLPELLKKADGLVIRKFLTMRFDINNATKQHLAMKELGIRSRLAKK